MRWGHLFFLEKENVQSASSPAGIHLGKCPPLPTVGAGIGTSLLPPCGPQGPLASEPFPGWPGAWALGQRSAQRGLDL